MMVWVAVIGALVAAIALLVTLSTIVFNMGRLSARVEEVETWRQRVREDFSEVSTALDLLRVEVARATERLEGVRTALQNHDQWERSGRP